MAYLYKRMRKQYSIDNGVSWIDSDPPEYIAGELIDANSDCIPESGETSSTTFQWVEVPFDSGNNETYICNGLDLYGKEKLQISYDSGKTWEDVEPPVYQIGDLIEKNSEICGYETCDITVSGYTDGNISNKYDYLLLRDCTVDPFRCMVKGAGNFYYYPELNQSVAIAEAKDCHYFELTSNNADGSLFNTRVKYLDVFGTSCFNSLYKTFYHNKDILKYNNINTWDTSNVDNMSGTFLNNHSLLEIDLSSFDTQKVTTFNSMFENDSSLTEIDISNFKFDSMTEIDNMFFNCQSLKEITFPNSYSPNEFHMWGTFENCYLLENINNIKNFKVDNCIYFHHLFWDCHNLKSLDISGWNFAKKLDTNNTGWFFKNNFCLEYVDISNLKSNDENYFSGGLIGQSESAYKPYFKIDNIKSKVLSNISTDIGTFNYENLSEEPDIIFIDELANSSITTLYFDDNHNIKELSMSIDENGYGYWDYDLTEEENLSLYTIIKNNAIAINRTPVLNFKNNSLHAYSALSGSKFLNKINAENLNFDECTDFNKFLQNDNLKEVILPKEIDMSKCTSAEEMFGGGPGSANNLNYINLNIFKNTNNIKDMSNMFYHFAGYIDGIEIFKTDSVENMGSMFQAIPILLENEYFRGTNILYDLSSWNTNNVTDVSYMFSAIGYNVYYLMGGYLGYENYKIFDYDIVEKVYNHLPMINISNFNLTKANNFSSMFRASLLKELIAKDVQFNHDINYDNYFYFYNAYIEKIDLTNWYVKNFTFNIFDSLTVKKLILDGWESFGISDLKEIKNINVLEEISLINASDEVQKTVLSQLEELGIKDKIIIKT